MINPEWLRYFVTLSETLNFHQAADQLHITPQALSHAVAGLETHFKVRLVDRDKRVKGLTPAGDALLPEARAALMGIENVERAMAGWQNRLPQGPVTIASVGLCQNYVLPPLIATLLGRFPLIRPRMHLMLPDDVETWVAAGEVDIGLLLGAPTRPGLTHQAGFKSPYVIVGAPQETRPWQEFGYIVPQYFRRAVASSDGWPTALERRVVIEVDLLESALSLAEAGVGVAFVPELSAHERLAQGRLKVVAEPPVAFFDQLFVVWREGVRHTLAAQQVLAALAALE
jgi:DNA-binding transcriptional LysR family regulator